MKMYDVEVDEENDGKEDFKAKSSDDGEHEDGNTKKLQRAPIKVRIVLFVLLPYSPADYHSEQAKKSKKVVG